MRLFWVVQRPTVGNLDPRMQKNVTWRGRWHVMYNVSSNFTDFNCGQFAT